MTGVQTCALPIFKIRVRVRGRARVKVRAEWATEELPKHSMALMSGYILN